MPLFPLLLAFVELVGLLVGSLGGAVKLAVPGSVFCASARMSSSFNTEASISIIVNWLGSGLDWSLLRPGLQTCPQAFPPTTLAEASGPSWFRKDG